MSGGFSDPALGRAAGTTAGRVDLLPEARLRPSAFCLPMAHRARAPIDFECKEDCASVTRDVEAPGPGVPSTEVRQ